MKSGIIKEIDKWLVELATPELEELIDCIESERIARIESEEYEKKTEAGKMEKKIYMLRGSGDGMLAAYGNAKQALKNAIKYVTQCGSKVNGKESKIYNDLCKTGFAIVESVENEYGISSVEILQVYLNNDLNI